MEKSILNDGLTHAMKVVLLCEPKQGFPKDFPWTKANFVSYKRRHLVTCPKCLKELEKLFPIKPREQKRRERRERKKAAEVKPQPKQAEKKPQVVKVKSPKEKPVHQNEEVLEFGILSWKKPQLPVVSPTPQTLAPAKSEDPTPPPPSVPVVQNELEIPEVRAEVKYYFGVPVSKIPK